MDSDSASPVPTTVPTLPPTTLPVPTTVPDVTTTSVPLPTTTSVPLPPTTLPTVTTSTLPPVTTTSVPLPTTTVPPLPGDEFPSDHCDGAGGATVVDGFAGDAYTKVRTAPGSESGSTLVCVAFEAGGLHLGGSLSVDGGATPSLDTDFGACDDQADEADLHHERAPSVLGQELFHLDVNLMGDELWVCARLADDPSTDRRVVIAVDPGSLPDLTPALDSFAPHDPPYPVTPPTDPGLPSSACQEAASSDATRVVNTDAGGSHTWLYAWQESATKTHVCVRSEGTSDAGGRLTVDGNGDQTFLTTSTDVAPCDVNVITDGGGPGPVPSSSVKISDPESGVPASACVTVGTGVAQRVTVDAGDQSVVTWTPDP